MSDTTEPLDLDEAKRLCDAASPGPWAVERDDEAMYTYVRSTTIKDWRREIVEIHTPHDTWADFEFIAAARTLLPDALAELVQARADLADLRALFDLQWTRMGEATERWRAEDPEARALVMPDLGDLLRWLIGEQDRQRDAVRRVCARIIANAHLLDAPFTDAPDLSPWVLLKRDMAALYAAVGIRFAVPDAEAPGGTR